MDAAIARRALQQIERAPSLLGRQTSEGFRRAHHSAKLDVGRPVRDVGDLALNPIRESGFLSRVHYPFERLDLAIHCSHVAALGGEIKRCAVNVASRHEHFRFCRRMDLASQHAIGPNPPMLWTTILLEELESLSPPRLV